MWHVEHATEPSHAPVAMVPSNIWLVSHLIGVTRTFKVDIVLVRKTEQVVALVPLRRLDQVPLRVLPMHADPAPASARRPHTHTAEGRTQCPARAA